MVKKGDIEAARNVFNQIYSPEEVGLQLESIQAHAQKSKSATSSSLFSKKYKTPLMLAFFISFFNQFSGINALLYYAKRIFSQAGLGDDAVLLSTVGIGIANFIFTILGVMLIDRLGRRQLMYIGSVGYIITLAATSMAFFNEWSAIVPPALFLFIGAHAIGQGAVIWVFISEIFPNHIRSEGQSFGVSVHWILAALIPSLVPVMFTKIGPGVVFAIFTGFMILQLLFVWKVMPETKGKTLEQLEDGLAG